MKKCKLVFCSHGHGLKQHKLIRPHSREHTELPYASSMNSRMWLCKFGVTGDATVKNAHPLLRGSSVRPAGCVRVGWALNRSEDDHFGPTVWLPLRRHAAAPGPDRAPGAGAEAGRSAHGPRVRAAGEGRLRRRVPHLAGPPSETRSTGGVHHARYVRGLASCIVCVCNIQKNCTVCLKLYFYYVAHHCSGQRRVRPLPTRRKQDQVL